MNKIVFFSSDASKLYKNDVFRCLSWAEGYCIRFRYENKYLHEDLRKDPTSLKGKQAAIFFVAGNNPPTAGTPLTRFPIRNAEILDVIYESKVGEFSFILKLGKFADVQISSSADETQLPPDAWVADVETTEKESNWLDRVKSIESHFEGTLFFHVNQVLDKKKPITPKFSNEKLESYYKLTGEKRYVMDMVFYDPSQEAAIKIETENGSLAVKHPPRVGAKKDAKRIVLRTSTMTHLFDDASIKIIGSEDYFAEINWEIHKSFFKTIQFGAATLLGALGAGLVILSRSDFSTLKFEWPNVTLGIAGLALIGITAGWLYRFFHKK